MKVEDSDPGRNDDPGGMKHTGVIGYHSLGRIGDARTARWPSSSHYGGIAKMRVHGDYAYVGVLSSDALTPGRGLVM